MSKATQYDVMYLQIIYPSLFVKTLLNNYYTELARIFYIFSL